MADHRSPDDPPFRSARPDGRAADAPYQPPTAHGRLSDQELAGRLKKTERDFYWSRHEDRGKTRGELEREWNDLKAEQARRKGDTWTYKHDRRDEATFRVERTEKNGQVRTKTTADHTAHHPDQTIHWRSEVPYAKSRYSSIQTEAKKRGRLNPGDDLGHLVADEHGSDPEGVNRGVVTSRTRIGSVARPNYTSQGATTNEHAAWRTQERTITEHGRTAPVPYRIESIATEKRGLHHEQSRTLDASQTINGKTQTLATSKVAHGGFADHATARRRGADEIQDKKDKVQQMTDAKKTKSAEPTKSTPSTGTRSNVVPISQARGAAPSGPKKSR